MAAKLLTVFALAIVELWAAIPAGLALGLHPVATGLASAAGAISGVVIVVTISNRARDWVLRRRSLAGREGRLKRIWSKYGIAGLGLLAPLLTGAPLGAALGIALGAAPMKLVAWMVLGIAAWTAILTPLATLGHAGLGLFWR